MRKKRMLNCLAALAVGAAALPPTALAEGRPMISKPFPMPAEVSLETLEAIADCESGGDPRAISAGGTYRGKYQFSVDTWQSVGGSGDPAAASEAEQDYRAALLYAAAGSSPWPNCGA